MRPFLLRFHARSSLLLLACAAVLLLAGCGRMSDPTRSRSATAPSAPAAFVLDQYGTPVEPGHAIVRLANGVAAFDFVSAHPAHQLVIVDEVLHEGVTYLLVRSLANPNSLTLPADLAGQGVAWTEKLSMVWAPEGDAEPMICDDGDGFHTTGEYLNQGSVEQVDLAHAHEMATGLGVRVAILDTGLDPSHPVFMGSGTLTLGYDHTATPPVSWTNETQDRINSDGDQWTDEACGHGTHVAGIIRLAAPGANLIALKVLNDDGWGTSWGVSWAIVEAVTQHNADVLNLSFGMREEHTLVREKIQWAAAQGVVIVASAGNRGNIEPQWPAAWDEVISVTTVEGHDILTDFANLHGSVDLTAPGLGIVSAIPTFMGLGEYAFGSGGSMATPWVAAAAALVLERMQTHPTSSHTVLQLLQDGSVPILDLNPEAEGLMGSGRVRLSRPLELL